MLRRRASLFWRVSSDGPLYAFLMFAPTIINEVSLLAFCAPTCYWIVCNQLGASACWPLVSNSAQGTLDRIHSEYGESPLCTGVCLGYNNDPCGRCCGRQIYSTQLPQYVSDSICFSIFNILTRKKTEDCLLWVRLKRRISERKRNSSLDYSFYCVPNFDYVSKCWRLILCLLPCRWCYIPINSWAPLVYNV